MSDAPANHPRMTNCLTVSFPKKNRLRNHQSAGRVNYKGEVGYYSQFAEYSKRYQKLRVAENSFALEPGYTLEEEEAQEGIRLNPKSILGIARYMSP